MSTGAPAALELGRPPCTLCRARPDLGGRLARAVVDRYYLSPEGRRFRSVPDIGRFLTSDAAGEEPAAEAVPAPPAPQPTPVNEATDGDDAALVGKGSNGGGEAEAAAEAAGEEETEAGAQAEAAEAEAEAEAAVEADAVEQKEDTPCTTCGACDDAAHTLLCDGRGCDRAYHIYCLSPPLAAVPRGRWLCPSCTEVWAASEAGSRHLARALHGEQVRVQRNLRASRVPSFEGGVQTRF